MIIDKIEEKKILVVGDFMLDSYWMGNVERISPEAPVPVFLKTSNRSVVGGAANVAANLIAAGQKVVVASVIGDDENGKLLLQKLECIGCITSLIFCSKERKTTVKTRILAQNNQQLLRIDDEQHKKISGKEEAELLNSISQEIETFDAVILSDYLKGVLSNILCNKIIEMANQRKIPVFADIKDKNAEKYYGVKVVKPNRKELQFITNMPVNSAGEIKEACAELERKCGCEYILVTLGADGMALYHKNSILFISGEAKEVFDVSGAGDTVISYLTSCYINNYSMFESAKIANSAAGLKVGKVGTATVSIDELKRYFNENVKRDIRIKKSDKIVDVKKIVQILHNNPNKKVVFTNGCFDILHAGHVSYLEEAANFGDLLILGLNSDASVKRLKGESRPINSEKDRALVLSSLESIDYIVIFDEDTPLNLIEKIHPDVLVKGADYKKEEVIGADFVEKEGGKVELIPFLKNHSTTDIISKL